MVYCSATGASEPRNLGYMERLGLWGPGVPSFANFQVLASPFWHAQPVLPPSCLRGSLAGLQHKSCPRQHQQSCMYLTSCAACLPDSQGWLEQAFEVAAGCLACMLC